MPEFITISNPDQPVSEDGGAARSIRGRAILDTLTVRERADLPLDSAQELSRELDSIYDLAGRAQGVAPADIRLKLQTVRDKKNDHVTRELTDRITNWRTLVGLRPQPVASPAVPPPTDPSFWWANSWAWGAPSTTVDFRNDGLHFNDGPKENEDNADLRTSSGLIATFTLQPERMPASQNGFFTSSPHVELFGGLVAFASDWGITHGHGIASCDLVLRQSLFQYGLQAPDVGGAAHVMVAEAISTKTLINLEDTDYSRHVDMPGYTFVPPVRFHQSQLLPGDLQAEIEVRFDIYLKAGGALVWCAPEIIARTFQWPLLADA